MNHASTSQKNPPTEEGQRLLDAEQLAKRLSEEGRITAKMVKRWQQKRKIPFVKMGYRTILFDPAAVWEAVKKFEIQPWR